MHCAKFGWNWRSGSGWEDFKISSNVFLLFGNYLPGVGSSFEKNWIPFTQGYFVPSLVEIGPVGLEKKMKMLKVYGNDNNDDKNNDGQRANFDQKSSLEPSAQVS